MGKREGRRRLIRLTLARRLFEFKCIWNPLILSSKSSKVIYFNIYFEKISSLFCLFVGNGL